MQAFEANTFRLSLEPTRSVVVWCCTIVSCSVLCTVVVAYVVQCGGDFSGFPQGTIFLFSMVRCILYCILYYAMLTTLPPSEDGRRRDFDCQTPHRVPCARRRVTWLLFLVRNYYFHTLLVRPAPGPNHSPPGHPATATLNLFQALAAVRCPLRGSLSSVLACESHVLQLNRRPFSRSTVGQF